MFQRNQWREYHKRAIYWANIGWDIVHTRPTRGVYVLGYIKCGTNWVCHLLSEALHIPIHEPWTLDHLTFNACVYHMHRFVPLEAVRRRTVYVMRDGRDAIVSAYFNVCRTGDNAFKRSVERSLGFPIVAENVKSTLPDFIRVLETNRIASTDYRSHLLTWQRYLDQYITLRYEDLLVDAGGELSRVVEKLIGREVDPLFIEGIVERNEFKLVTKRHRGVEDQNSFLRKGIAGDWKNYFTSDAAHVFDAYAGDLLLQLGYETDPGWASKLA